MSTSKITADAVSVGIVAAIIAAAFVAQSHFTATAQEPARQLSPQQEPPTPVLDKQNLMELFTMAPEEST